MTFDEPKNIQWSSSSYVKVPVELELSKLQSRDDLAEKYAKHSKEGLWVEFDDFYQSYGVPQSLPCLRACLAVLNLVNQRQSPGKRKRFHRSRSEESQSAETEQDGDRQTVSFDMLEYYEAYGLEGSGGKAAVEANQGLRMLQKDRYLEVTDWTTRCKQLLHEPLITVLFRGDQTRKPQAYSQVGRGAQQRQEFVLGP